MEFPRHLEHACFRQSDIVFYGFSSSLQGRAQAMAYAAEFRDAIDRLHSAPQELMPHHVSTHRKGAILYSSVTFVAHSLGAPLCRQALLDATLVRSDWAQQVRLLLFAPAHKGVRALGLRLLGLVCPVLHDLRENSIFLTDLERNTLLEINKGNADQLVAKKVIFGSKERMVNMSPFAQDPPIISINGKDHGNVCKPNDTYMQPLNELARVP